LVAVYQLWVAATLGNVVQSVSVGSHHSEMGDLDVGVVLACGTQKSVSLTHTTVLLLFWNLSGTTRVSRYQKGKTRKTKTNLDLLEQEIVSGSGICWAICKFASHPRQPHQHPTTQFFYRPDALPAAQPTVSQLVE